MSTDPTALAREVLDIHDAWGKTIAGSDECARASDAFTSALRRNGGDLARAVTDLTATVKRMEALADEMDRLAAWERTPPAGTMTVTTSPYADGLDEAAARIRAALNEETPDDRT